jgi:hypothetical protein
MTKGVMHDLATGFRAITKRGLAVFKKVGGANILAGLVAVVLLASACAVETKAILSLETSQNLFEIMR